MWLGLPPLLLCALDGALTLAGQPAAYWQGDRAAARELNPLFDLLLRYDPGVAVAGLVVWLVMIALAVLLLPGRSAFLAAFACAFGHACGAASWMVTLGVPGWVLAVLLLIAAERLVALSWRAARRQAAGDGTTGGLTPRRSPSHSPNWDQ